MEGDEKIPRPMEEGGSESDDENIARSLEQLELEADADPFAHISAVLSELPTEAAFTEYFRENPLVAEVVSKLIIDQNAEPTDSHEAPPLPSLSTRRSPEKVLPAPYVLSGLAEFFGENIANETIEEIGKDTLGDDPDNTTAPFTSLGKRRTTDELDLSSQKRARHDEWKQKFEETFEEFQNPVTRDFWLQAGFIGYATKDFGSADEPLPEEPLPDEPPEQILEELLEEIAALIEPLVIATDISEAFGHAYWAASPKTRAEITTWTEHYLNLPADSSSNHQHPDVFLTTALRAALLQFANTNHDSQTRIIALIQRCIPNLPPIYLLLLEMVMDNDPQNL